MVYIYHLPPHGALLEGGGGITCIFCTAVVHSNFPAIVTALIWSRFAWLKKACIGTTYSGWWSHIQSWMSPLKPPSVPKGWSLWTSSWHCRSYAPLIVWIISPFPIVISIGQGVPRGPRSPSSSLNSPWGQFYWSPSSLQKGVEAWWVRTPIRTLLAIPPVGTGILVPPTWWSNF